MVDTWLTPKEKSTAKSTGMMLPEPSENEIKASEPIEKVNDNERELFFNELLNKSSLFKVGFSPEHLYYQKKLMKNPNFGGFYFPEDRELGYFESKAIDYPTTAGRELFGEIAQRIKDKEIIEGDFVFMGGHMLPGDRVRTNFSKDEVAEMGTLSGAVSVRDLLDKSDELGTHMHEFVHRALRVVPELNEWRKKNLQSNVTEEILMAAIVSKYFPDLAESETNRMKINYKADLNNKRNKKLSNKWINEIETIANNILENKGVKIIKPKIKPKPKPKSIMGKEKIIPKIKPKPEQEKKQRTWMEIIKGLFK